MDNWAPMKKALALLLVAALMPLTALAQQRPPDGRVFALDGTVTRAVTATATPTNLNDKDPVFVGNRIETKERAIVKMLMGGKAVVTVRELSALTITEVSGKTTVNLDSGKVAIWTRGLQRGDSIEVKTPNAIASVRGSLGIVETGPGISHIDNADGTVLGAATGGVLQPIPPGQGLTITGNVLGALRAIRPNVHQGLEVKKKPGAGQKPKPSESDLASDLSSLGGSSGTAMPGASPLSGALDDRARVLPGNPKSGVYVP